MIKSDLSADLVQHFSHLMMKCQGKHECLTIIHAMCFVLASAAKGWHQDIDSPTEETFASADKILELLDIPRETP